MDKFIETEYKYKSPHLSVNYFKRVMENIFIDYQYKFLYISSIDDYYYNDNYSDIFIRNRLPDNNNEHSNYELTLKQKRGSDILCRTEINIPIDKQSTDPESISEFLAKIDFILQFSLHKKCWIYFFENFEVVLYDISKDKLNYQRFLEIEAKHGFDKIDNNTTEKLNYLLMSFNIDSNEYVNFSQFDNFKS